MERLGNRCKTAYQKRNMTQVFAVPLVWSYGTGSDDIVSSDLGQLYQMLRKIAIFR